MAQVVGGDQDRAALVAELKKQLGHQLLRAHINPIEGLIQQQHISALGDGSGQERALALTTGEGAKGTIGQLQQINPRQGVPHSHTIGAAGNPQRIHRAVAAHHHHIPHRHGELGIHPFALGHIGHRLMPLGFGNAAAVDPDSAARRANKPSESLEERRFTGTVHAHQTADATGWQVQAGVVQGNGAVVVHTELVGLNAHQRLLSDRSRPLRIRPTLCRCNSNRVGAGPSGGEREST